MNIVVNNIIATDMLAALIESLKSFLDAIMICLWEMVND